MALTKLESIVTNIQALSNQPNASDGLTPEQVKLAFDQAGMDIKEYLNDTLTVEIEATYATIAEIQGIVLGAIPDNSLTIAKLEASLKTSANTGLLLAQQQFGGF